MDIDSCLKVLELPENATADEIKNSYRELVQIWHPDRFTNSEKLRARATEKLKEINEAYRYLIRFLENPRFAQPTPKYNTGTSASDESTTDVEEQTESKIRQLTSELICLRSEGYLSYILYAELNVVRLNKVGKLLVSCAAIPDDGVFCRICWDSQDILIDEISNSKNKLMLMRGWDPPNNKLSGYRREWYDESSRFIAEQVIETVIEMWKISPSQLFEYRRLDPHC